MSDVAEVARKFDDKDAIINEILEEEDLYRILGASPDSSPSELRKCYLERSKICHPDKLPYHPLSTSAFQRLGYAFEILRTPRSRRTYDRASGSVVPDPLEVSAFVGGDQTFRASVAALWEDFLGGDFVIVRRWLGVLHTQYPNLVSKETTVVVEQGFLRIRDMLLTTRIYALLVYVELGRIHRVQKRLLGLGYLDVVGRARLTFHLVRVTLAVPMRVDRALKQREERAWRARQAGLQAAGLPLEERLPKGGILNDRVSQVLEFIVGHAGKDEDGDNT